MTRWSRDGQGYVCKRCGASNPAPSDKCVNCDEELFDRLDGDERMTPDKYRTFLAATSKNGA